jgi:hypothetical protein
VNYDAPLYTLPIREWAISFCRLKKVFDNIVTGQRTVQQCTRIPFLFGSPFSTKRDSDVSTFRMSSSWGKNRNRATHYLILFCRHENFRLYFSTQQLNVLHSWYIRISSYREWYLRYSLSRTEQISSSSAVSDLYFGRYPKYCLSWLGSFLALISFSR